MRTKKKRLFVDIGEGIDLNKPEKIIHVGYDENHRKGHFWCFGTTRAGKTKVIAGTTEEDINKGHSVVVIDPKGDSDLFSKIVESAFNAGRENDLMLISPVFPQYSAHIDPLASYYMVEELVAHITAGVSVGKDPYYYGVAYEISLLVVQALILLSKEARQQPSFNLSDIKNNISPEALEDIKENLDYLDTPEANQIANDLGNILKSSAEFNTKVSSGLRIALTELTSGNIGKIIGNVDADQFVDRLESGKKVIMVVQLGSLLTKRAAYSAGKVIISMLQAYVGRKFASGATVNPPISLHIDEAQSVLYHGIEDLFAKAGGAGIYIHGYCQSISQLVSEVGQDRASTILDCCNTKMFMRVSDTKTAQYISTQLGEKRTYSPIISLGGGLSIRETEETRIKHTEVLSLQPRQFFLTTYSGVYRGITREIPDADVKVVFPDIH